MNKRAYRKPASNNPPLSFYPVFLTFSTNIRPIRFTFSACLFAFVFSILCLPDVVFAQVQLGTDIENETSQIESNASVSLSADGNRLAVGARDNDGNGSRSGHVRVHRWTGAAWQQLGSDIDGEATEDLSGDGVSLSGNGERVAIGAIGNDGNGEDSGHVRVYQWNGAEWVQLGSDLDFSRPL